MVIYEDLMIPYNEHIVEFSGEWKDTWGTWICKHNKEANLAEKNSIFSIS